MGGMGEEGPIRGEIMRKTVGSRIMPRSRWGVEGIRQIDKEQSRSPCQMMSGVRSDAIAGIYKTVFEH